MIELKYPKFWNHRSFIAKCLLPLGWLYLLIGKIRQLVTRPVRLHGHVICVGNMTVGGTGKTQIVLWISRYLAKQGIRFVIVSKGYGGSYRNPTIVTQCMSHTLVGDEALELCSVGTTIVSRRVTDAIDILSDIKPEVIIVDDGMQNNSFYKDHLVLIIDGNRFFGNGFPIPAGPMRQIKCFDKVDSVVCVGGDNSEFNKQIPKRIPLFDASISPLTKLDKNLNYYAFAAIGNPERFFNTLRAVGVNLVATKEFSDHHSYSIEDIELIVKNADSLNATPITSRKDYVKICNTKYSKRIVPFDVVIDIKDSEQFIKTIYEKALS